MRNKISSSKLRLGMLGLLVAFCYAIAPASAGAYEGEFAKFDYCPVTTSGVETCLVSVTSGGKVELGTKDVPIVNPVTLQGGVSEENANHVSKFYGATNGETLSKTPQPVPGGLAGLVKCEDISEPVAKLLCQLTFENGLTGVNATLELAGSASEIKISEYNLERQGGTALEMPVKMHLENPLLGSSCYVGSNSAPIIWNLTSGTTSPPSPFEPISGKGGEVTFRESFEIIELSNDELVENDWPAPGASGCGGLLAPVIDPVIDAMIKLPNGAGENTAILKNTIWIAPAATVAEH